MSAKKSILRIPIYGPQHKIVSTIITQACKKNEFCDLELQLTIVNDKQDISFTFVDIFKFDVKIQSVLPEYKDFYIQSLETKDDYIIIEFDVKLYRKFV